MKKIYALLAGVVLAVSAYSQCSVTTSVVNATCNGLCNGSASTTISGFIPNVTYSWAPSGGNGSSATNLCAGVYTVTVTDGICTATAVATVTEPAVLTATGATSPVSCLNGNDGMAMAMPMGGTSPYSYSWNTVPVQTNDTASGLTAGNYSCIVTDANGCSTSIAVTVTQPSTAVSVATSFTEPTCFGNSDGTATATATGGTPPYYYAWSTTDSTAGITGIAAGTYIVTAWDTNGCMIMDTVMVTQPAVLMANVTTMPASCNGVCDAIAMSNPTGGTAPYMYMWTSTATTQVDSGLCVGTQGVLVTDANGCTANQIVTTTQPTAVTVSASGTDATCIGCQNGSATATAGGGVGGYSYMWTPGNQTTATASGLGLGTYVVCVTDSNGCGPVCDTVMINDGTGVPSFNSTWAVNVYPNPANDVLNISIQTSAPVTVAVNLYDISGRVIVTENLGEVLSHNKAFDLSGETSGIYFLEVIVDGQKNTTKLVKE